MEQARSVEAAGDPGAAFKHLENAHVLGQESTYWHVKVHWRMLLWAWRYQQPRELCGQLLRIAGAAVLTAVGAVPTGNTGGSNVSPVKPMPISDEHAGIIAGAKQGA